MNAGTRTRIYIGLVVAVGIGSYWIGYGRKPDDASEVTAAAVDASRELGRLRKENARLLATIEKLSTPQNAVAEVNETADPLANLDPVRLVNVLKERGLILFPVGTANMQTGKLEPGFSKFFNLTPIESEKAQQVIDKGRQQMDQLIVANATVSRRDDGALIISYGPLNGGSSIRDEFMTNLSQILGPDRYAALVALQKTNTVLADLNYLMNDFGGTQRTMTLSRTMQTDGITPLINFLDVATNPNPSSENPSSSHGGNGGFLLSSPPAGFSWVVPLLPADF